MPRVIRTRHDLPTPLLGLSPYQMVFGRERPLVGLPTSIEVRCPTADAFMDHMQDLDRHVSHLLNDELAKQEARLNKRRPREVEFEPEEWVWILRPTALTRRKLQSWWIGPYRVVERNGDQSYTVRLGHHNHIMVHADQMKKCTISEVPEILETLAYTLGDTAEHLSVPLVDKVLKQRKTTEGIELLVQWKGSTPSEATWVEPQKLVDLPPWACDLLQELGRQETRGSQVFEQVRQALQ